MKKQILLFVSVIASFNAYAYCTPDNETCFDCGTNCVAELTYTKDSNNNNIGTFTVYGTGENGAGEMSKYSYTGETPNRTTTAPWKDKLSEINNIVISEGVTNIGGFTFNGAKNLSQVELPESVKTIGSAAFLESWLETINTLKNVTTIENAVFFRSNLSGHIELNENLTKIREDVFYHTKISSINIPDSVTSIGYLAFGICRNLSDIRIPDSVTSIDKAAFIDFYPNFKVYCNNIGGRCDRLFADAELQAGQYVPYVFEGNRYVLNGQKYHTFEDMQKGINAVKRIYTVEEISKASGKKNTIMIRYK